MAVSTELGLVIRRDPKTESSADVKLFELGFREAKDPRLDPGTLELPAKRMAQVSKDLVAAGWRVEAEGKLIRPAGEFKLALSTGIDWFELGGGVDFEGQSVSLPDLLAAAKRGEPMVELGDGSMGMLPEEWLKRYGMLADLATGSENGCLQFSQSQAGMLDALLAAQPEISVDAAFEKVRQNLRQFEGVVPLDSPPGFHGELRPYQREGLGWLDYLQRFGFGGILADDMGLGKTIQVLALLQRRRAHRQAKGPSLAVVPRSLVFNWIQEAEKFTPRLRVLDYTGPGRHPLRESFQDYDLIVTTYGTVRTDIAELTPIEFDYAILDEAQAVKNAESQSAKAARLLRSRFRLAISGTPIENHIGELWSIFEFLNPGMLGSDTVFKKYASSGAAASSERTAPGARGFGQGSSCGRSSSAGPSSRSSRTCPRRPSRRSSATWRPSSGGSTTSCGSTTATLLVAKDSGRSQPIQDRGIGGSILRLRQAACHPVADQPRAGHRRQRQARHAPALDLGGRRGGAQGPGLLAVHQLPGDRPGAARRGEDRLRIPGRPDARPQGAGRALSERRRLPALPDQPEGRRPGPEPDRGGVRLPARPVVEPGRRGATGDRPRRTGSARRSTSSPTG